MWSSTAAGWSGIGHISRPVSKCRNDHMRRTRNEQGPRESSSMGVVAAVCAAAVCGRGRSGAAGPSGHDGSTEYARGAVLAGPAQFAGQVGLASMRGTRWRPVEAKATILIRDAYPRDAALSLESDCDTCDLEGW